MTALTRKVRLGHTTVYTATGSVPVFGGLPPLNVATFELLPLAELCLHFGQRSYTLLQTPHLVTVITSPTCDVTNNCTAYFLPGGLDHARLRTRTVDRTLLSGSFSGENISYIRVTDAPGYHLEFSSLSNHSFDIAKDCTIYGKERGDGAIMCIAMYGGFIVAGSRDRGVILILRVQCLSHKPL